MSEKLPKPIGHHRWLCSCGRVISQCRCIRHTGKEERTFDHPACGQPALLPETQAAHEVAKIQTNPKAGMPPNTALIRVHPDVRFRITNDGALENVQNLELVPREGGEWELIVSPDWAWESAKSEKMDPEKRWDEHGHSLIEPGVRYVSHLHDDQEPNRTLCGEPWQGWQVPSPTFERAVLPPWTKPTPHKTQIHQCQLCFQKTMMKG